MSAVKKPATGHEVDARCLKCKGVTNHIICAMDGDSIAKVQCKVCGASHRYRPPVAEKKKPVVRSRRQGPGPSPPPPVSRQTAREATLFAAAVSDRDPVEAAPYATTATFRTNDLIRHPHFGLGVVLGTIQPDKIEVRFREGTKILICRL